MQNSGTQPNKSGRIERKPATVTLDDGTVIDAAHHFTTDDNRILHLYLDSRDGGIDVSVPLNCDGMVWARTPAGERALGITSEQDEAELVTDGGLHGDTQTIIEYDDEMWVVGATNGAYARLYPAGRNPNAPTVVEVDVIDPNGGEGSW